MLYDDIEIGQCGPTIKTGTQRDDHSCESNLLLICINIIRSRMYTLKVSQMNIDIIKAGEEHGK